VIVTRAGMILVEFPMVLSQRPMIGAVLSVAVEAFFVRVLMSPASPSVVLAMLGVVPCVPVIVIVCEGGYDGEH
jgi:hypothetical protein